MEFGLQTLSKPTQIREDEFLAIMKRSQVATLLDLTGIVAGGEDLNVVVALGKVNDFVSFLRPDMLRVSFGVL